MCGTPMYMLPPLQVCVGRFPPILVIVDWNLHIGFECRNTWSALFLLMIGGRV